jgi:hypothetical protein
MYSQFFILSSRGDTLLYKDCNDHCISLTSKDRVELSQETTQTFYRRVTTPVPGEIVDAPFFVGNSVWHYWTSAPGRSAIHPHEGVRPLLCSDFYPQRVTQHVPGVYHENNRHNNRLLWNNQSGVDKKKLSPLVWSCGWGYGEVQLFRAKFPRTLATHKKPLWILWKDS